MPHFDPSQSSRPASEEGRTSGGGLDTPNHGRRPGPTAARDIETAYWLGPLLFAVALLIVGVVWVLP